MKRVLPIMIIGLLLSSCASNRRSEGKDIDDITNVDFKQEPQVRYNKSEDYYDIFDSLGPRDDSLIEETMQRAAFSGSDIKLDPDNNRRDELSQLATLCYRNDFKDALIIIDNLYRRYQKHPGYWNQVGNCYLLKGDLRKANIFYKQALKYNKNYAPAYNNIGNIHIRRKEYEKALAAFKKAHELKRTALTPAYNLSQVYLNFGVIGPAQKLLLNINKQRSGDPTILGALGTTYLFQGNIKKSLSYFRQISVDSLEQPSIGLNYSVALMISGDKKSAMKIFNHVDNDQPKWRKYYSKVKSFVRQR